MRSHRVDTWPSAGLIPTRRCTASGELPGFEASFLRIQANQMVDLAGRHMCFVRNHLVTCLLHASLYCSAAVQC